MGNHRLPKTVELNAMFVKGDKLIDSEGKSVWIVATHSDVEINNRIYTTLAMRNGVDSFVKPYKKPVLLNHDDYRDAIGRVQEAYYFYREDWEAAEKLIGASVKFPENATGAVVLKADIRDDDAVAKIEDERYFSVSIGFTTEVARCSICDKNWAEGPCKHVPGRKYGDEKCVLILEHMDFREVSFVNEPADKYARVVVPEETAESDTFYNSNASVESCSIEDNTPTITEEDNMSEEKLKDLESKVEKLEKIAKSEILRSMSDKLKAIDLETKDDYGSMDIDTLSAFRDMVSEIVDAAVAKFNKAEEVETETDSAELNKAQETQDGLEDVNMVAEISEKDIESKPETDSAEAEKPASDSEKPAETDSADSKSAGTDNAEHGDNAEADSADAAPETEENNNDTSEEDKAEDPVDAKNKEQDNGKKRIAIEDKNAVISTDVNKNRVTERPSERAKRLLGIK